MTNYDVNLYYHDVLVHHGILGQKWGVRRFQNKDGTLTAAGRKRVAQEESDGQTTSKIESRKTTSKKGVSSMSDDDLRSAIARKKLENEYESYFPKQTSKGKQFVHSVRTKIVDPAFENIGKQAVTYFIGQSLNNIANKEIVNPKKGQKDK